MRDLFPGYYAPEGFQELWDKATFVFDANVLLNLYRFPKSAAQDLLGVLEKVSDRLWLPHQAALEYQVNRLTVIRQQREQFKNVRDALDKALADLTSSFKQFQLKKRHSTIDPKPLLTKTDELFEQFKAELDELEKTQPDVSDRDEIRERVDKLLSGRIGSPPKSQGELDQIYAEGKERYGYGRPPGYKDTDKSRDQTASVYFLNSLRFEREYGDLILWKQILQHCKQHEVQHLIFVIDDKKQDWWFSIGGKRIGARPELTDEITSEGGTKTFHMYDSERFLEFAKDYLKEQVKQESIVQIRDVIEANRVEAFRSIRSATFQEQAIRSWLGRAHPNSTITGTLGLIRERYVVRNPDGVRIVYEVQSAPDAFIYSTLKEIVQRANAEIHNGEFDTFVVILVLPDATLASELHEQIQRIPELHWPRVSFIISSIIHGMDGSGAERGVLNVLHEFL
jgi:hypothetical protein